MSNNFFNPQVVLAGFKQKKEMNHTGAETFETNETNKINQYLMYKKGLKHSRNILKHCEGNLEPSENKMEPSENKMEQKDTHLAEAQPIYKDTVLMTRHNGKPQSCIHCGRWQQEQGGPWWHGVCDINGAKKTNKSHCDVLTYEEVMQ